jgi:hypothetical protein
MNSVSEKALLPGETGRTARASKCEPRRAGTEDRFTPPHTTRPRRVVVCQTGTGPRKLIAILIELNSSLSIWGASRIPLIARPLSAGLTPPSFEFIRDEVAVRFFCLRRRPQAPANDRRTGRRPEARSTDRAPLLAARGRSWPPTSASLLRNRWPCDCSSSPDRIRISLCAGLTDHTGVFFAPLVA